MTSAGAVRHRVVVVRVEAPEMAERPWRVELLEVGRHSGGDRLLGRAPDDAAACLILQAWFDEIAGGAAPPGHDDPV